MQTHNTGPMIRSAVTANFCVQVAAGYVLHEGAAQGVLHDMRKHTTGSTHGTATCRQATINPACFAQVAAGYVLHKGVAQGVLRVGDSVTSRCVFRCHDHHNPARHC